MSQWSAFEHAFYRNLCAELEGLSVDGKKLLLAVSGGLDSMAMWELFNKFSSVLKINIGIVHIHHGSSDSAEIIQFRDNACAMVGERARFLGQPFYTAKSSEILRSEAEFRDFRKAQIEKIRLENNFSWAVWAHHEDDFLETQILRLIRGTGELGIEPMYFLRGVELRPLLKFSRSQLKDYATGHQIPFVEDPSNLDGKYLRNWLRNDWLPQLEAKSPGALRSISRSLLILSREKESLPENIFQDQKLSRAIYITLTPAERRAALARYIRSRGQLQFTHNHIEEVMKRLDKSDMEHSFKLAQMLWLISRDWIFADPVLLPKPS